MERMRLAAESVVRRLALGGLLGIATLAATLLRHPRTALDAVCLLLSLEAAVLWQLGANGRRVETGEIPVWLTLPGLERKGRTLYAALLAQAFRSYAMRLAASAAMAWGFDLVAHAA